MVPNLRNKCKTTLSQIRILGNIIKEYANFMRLFSLGKTETTGNLIHLFCFVIN